MLFKGISKEFSLLNEDQYNTIGDFWDEMASIYGLENLQGLGYKWVDDKIFYAIGLKAGDHAGDHAGKDDIKVLSAVYKRVCLYPQQVIQLRNKGLGKHIDR